MRTRKGALRTIATIKGTLFWLWGNHEGSEISPWFTRILIVHFPVDQISCDPKRSDNNASFSTLDLECIHFTARLMWGPYIRYIIHPRIYFESEQQQLLLSLLRRRRFNELAYRLMFLRFRFWFFFPVSLYRRSTSKACASEELTLLHSVGLRLPTWSFLRSSGHPSQARWEPSEVAGGTMVILHSGVPVPFLCHGPHHLGLFNFYMYHYQQE